MTGIEAATAANQQLLREIMARGENDYSDYPPLQKHPAATMIEHEAIRRGYHIRGLKNHFEIWRKETLIGIFSPNSPNISMAAREVARHKGRTKQILQFASLPVPTGDVFSDLTTALAYFRTCRVPQVIKPFDGSGGRGTTTGIEDETMFVASWQFAMANCRRAIVEDHVAGDGIRLIVLGGETIAAVCRIPAYVMGDGKRSIRDLVAEKNQHRQKNPLMCIYPLDRFDYMEQVSRRALEDIPFPGEYVRLSTVSNVSRGGEAVNLIDVLHPSFFELARRIHATIPGATLLGLDVISRDFGADAFTDSTVAIGINCNPAIATPRFAAYGKPAENIASQLLDFVEQQHSVQCLRKKRTPAAQLVAAPVYRAPCGGESFPRSYGIQMRLLRQAAFARGLQVDVVDFETTVIADSNRRRLFYQGMSDRTLWTARQATNDKEWTRQLLKRAGVNVPEGQVFTPDDHETGWAFACELGLPVVVKPFSGSGGKGISTDIRSLTHFRDAWHYATATGKARIIVERHYHGNDFRVFVVGHRLVAVAQRIPAHVAGDGVHTIEDLIALKNELRTANPHHGAKPMAITPAILRNLKEMGLSPVSVPAAGQKVSLHTVANIGGGGESVDVTDLVHPDWAEIAIKAREAVFDPPHIGLDLIAESMTLPPHAQQWAIVEINSNPDFGANHFPMQGPGRDVAGALLEHLFSEPPLLTVNVIIQGRVQAVGYRRWLWKQAHLRALCGWARNLPDGSVEAIFGGTAPAVEDMLDRCRQGPPRAKVEHISRKPWLGAVPEGFEIKT